MAYAPFLCAASVVDRRFIPMRVRAAPGKSVRVMVGRLELLTKERETLAARAIGDLSSQDGARREEAFGSCTSRAATSSRWCGGCCGQLAMKKRATLCRRLLLTEFVTELRSHPSPGRRGPPAHRPPHASRRACPATPRDRLGRRGARMKERSCSGFSNRSRLLRDSALPTPTSLRCAAAFEATGDDQKAAIMYDRGIELIQKTSMR